MPKGPGDNHDGCKRTGDLINAETGNLKLTQKFLGHSIVSTTADVYTHTSVEMESDAAASLEKAIFGDLFPIWNWEQHCSELGKCSVLSSEPKVQ